MDEKNKIKKTNGDTIPTQKNRRRRCHRDTDRPTVFFDSSTQRGAMRPQRKLQLLLTFLNLLGDTVRHLVIVTELHRVGSTPLGH